MSCASANTAEPMSKQKQTSSFARCYLYIYAFIYLYGLYMGTREAFGSQGCGNIKGLEHRKEGTCKRQTPAEPDRKDQLEPRNLSSELSWGSAHLMQPLGCSARVLV